MQFFFSVPEKIESKNVKLISIREPSIWIEPQPVMIVPQNPVTIIENDETKLLTYDGKPLMGQSEIIMQLSNGHTFCRLKRKRVKGFCVDCIKDCCNAPDYKNQLIKIDTFCSACTGSNWMCRTHFAKIHSIELKK